MQFSIVHETGERLRLKSGKPYQLAKHAASVHERLLNIDGVQYVSVSGRTGSIIIIHRQADRKVIFDTLAAFAWPEASARPKGHLVDLTPQRAYASGVDSNDVENPIVPTLLRRVFLPLPLRNLVTGFKTLPYIWQGVRSLFSGKLGVAVLDAAALTVCILRRDFRAASTITFFFALSEFLESWTKKKSRESLGESLALNIDSVWVQTEAGELCIPLARLEVGSTVIVRTGQMIPVDGTVEKGDGMVNQASMTGESLPVRRNAGSYVYAGTVLEEGELFIASTKVGSQTRINSILKFIEESENLKASVQSKAEHMADSIVPFSFLLSAAVYGITRDPMRAGSVLLVDYSCAIKLCTPLSILSAMREGAKNGVLIKGGKFLEALAEADTVVFDKTGTLTQAKPEVVEVIPFNGFGREEVLRLAACLEEHFPHPVGQAVVRQAEAEKLKHREEHAQVQYVMAHGIASALNGQKVVIGSEHFILEDEKILSTPEIIEAAAAQSVLGRSLLYLGVGGQIAGIIAIEDKLREDIAGFIQRLRDDGIKRILMLTGDIHATAASIAAQAGITEFEARVLPEDKARIVNRLKSEGCKVIMVGDGVNDSPALSAAHVGVSLTAGTDLAKEVADVIISGNHLEPLIVARQLSRLTLRKIKSNFGYIVGLNSVFLALGLFGLLRPGLSALLHNLTTAGVAIRSVKPVLPQSDEPEEIDFIDVSNLSDSPNFSHLPEASHLAEPSHLDVEPVSKKGVQA